MNNKTIKICVYISSILFIGFVSLFFYAEIADPHPNAGKQVTCPHISLGNNVNMTVIKDWGGSLILFNQAVPYMGSIITFTGDKTVSETGWDGLGIYFRAIKHTVRKDWDQWTLMISLWYPIILFGILPAIIVVKKLRNRKSASTKQATVEK